MAYKPMQSNQAKSERKGKHAIDLPYDGSPRKDAERAEMLKLNGEQIAAEADESVVASPKLARFDQGCIPTSIA